MRFSCTVIYPKSAHLKLVAILCSTVGCFPWQFMLTDNTIFQTAYKYYSRITLFLYFTLICSVYVELFSLVSIRPLRFDEIVRNVCLTLLCTNTITRQLIMRLKPQIRNIILNIINAEKYIKDTYDDTVIAIYTKCASNTTRKTVAYSLFVSITSLMHFIRPFCVYDTVVRRNVTLTYRSFPLSAWVPFDPYDYYWETFFLTSTWVLIGTFFLCANDILNFALIMYPSGQLEMLHNILRDFKHYKENIMKHNPSIGDKKASFFLLKKCIEMHKEIIKYVDDFNDSMSIFMVFDFLQTSLQLASATSQLVVMEFTPHTIGFVGGFFVMLMYRLCIIYYYANEILLLSEDLAYSAFKSNWYDLSPHTKYMFQIFMLRCKKPLVLKIGPFGFMTLSTLLSILQASYTYFMFIYSSQEK
ncbi:odorant receptor 30a-like [Anthonomus grandis grandis]|uniref:odorant receptor 30a-like n=1 Tax=Anthonomus grandis grandis TaxID=2921223 RepID=UPI002164F465|nr:odorant receptor 30a-like [Anthonomus grandis grandis]